MRRLLGDRRTFAGLLVLVVLASVVIGTLRNDDDVPEGSPDATPSIEVSPGDPPTESESPDDQGAGPAFPTAVAPSRPATDAESGLPTADLADLPPEAAETVALIEAGGPFPYDDDGETFLNSARLLPQHETGYYRVYTVETPGSVEPTSRRIVAGTTGELFWTDDLYTSFRRIQE